MLASDAGGGCRLFQFVLVSWGYRATAPRARCVKHAPLAVRAFDFSALVTDHTLEECRETAAESRGSPGHVELLQTLIATFTDWFFHVFSLFDCSYRVAA